MDEVLLVSLLSTVRFFFMSRS